MPEHDSTHETHASLPYPDGYFHHQSPAHLSTIARLAGARAPKPSGAFTWGELGCGSGLTAIVVAAANPEATVIGIDIDDAALDRARALAADAGVTNASFITGDLINLDPGRLPRFDYLTAHGLYTWVPIEVQGAIHNIAGTSVAPHGLFYLSYNTPPGWAALRPLRALFKARVQAEEGSPRSRARRHRRPAALGTRGRPVFSQHSGSAPIPQRTRNRRAGLCRARTARRCVAAPAFHGSGARIRRRGPHVPRTRRSGGQHRRVQAR